MQCFSTTDNFLYGKFASLYLGKSFSTKDELHAKIAPCRTGWSKTGCYKVGC